MDKQNHPLRDMGWEWIELAKVPGARFDGFPLLPRLPPDGTLTEEFCQALRANAKKHRTCGGCTACCTTHAVSELGKPPGQRCRHVCQQGCAIYDARPEGCYVFQCMWLTGDVADDEARPDKLGLVFDKRWNLSEVGWRLAGEASPFIITCNEYWPGAADEGTVGRSYLDRIIQQFMVQLVRTDGSVWLLPGWERQPDRGSLGR
jgi:hypothetical protein